MYLLDTNVLRAFYDGNPMLHLKMVELKKHEDRADVEEKIKYKIALPSVVIAEVLKGLAGFCGGALSALPVQVPAIHRRVLEHLENLTKFNIVVFDDLCAEVLLKLKKNHPKHKRYPDMMIAAMAKAGNHIVVTRNLRDFRIFLSETQIVNWLD